MYTSLKDIYLKESFGRIVPPAYAPNLRVNLIEEGGAAGHMDHPFDLPQVRTGKDIVKVFQDAVSSIQDVPPVVKIDGVNASIKLVTQPDGSMEFGLDRGSSKPLDVKGVTVNDLSDRFGEGHGMLVIGREVLDIFNKALPTIKEDLVKLGFTTKPYILNMEYVKGGTNVIGYADNFLAIHGVNEIYEVKSPVKGSISRRTREVSYSQETMNDLIEKVNKIAKQYKFRVVGSVPVTVKTKVNFPSVLNTEFTIKLSPEEAETKTLQAWLNECKNPKGVKITLQDGKKVDALSKQVYTNVYNGVDLSTFIKDGNQKEIKDAICGAVFYHATRVLGQAVLDSLTSEMGDVTDQEGIVIRNSSISPRPFKITGDFIVRGLDSKFARQEDDETVTGLLNNIATANNSYINPPYDRATGGVGAGGGTRVGAEVS